MPPKMDQYVKPDVNKGAWTSDEDQKLIQCIKIHGDRRWRSIAAKAGLNRCGKSCRFRWLNYLRPNIKKGNFSDQEEDLIIRLHKLLGNRWSLIAKRLPGRTDNEIKNYWNSHLSKQISKQKEKQDAQLLKSRRVFRGEGELRENSHKNKEEGDSIDEFDVDEFFDFSRDEVVGRLLGSL